MLAEIEALITRLPPYSDQREQFSLALYGTSETLKIDGEGRVVLSDALKTHAGITDAVIFVGLGHKFRILGARPLSRGTRGGHRQGPRLQAGAGHPDGGGKTAWSTGTMTGSDSDCCRWRTGSSHSRARSPRRRRGSACVTAASMSTRRSAPAVTRARTILGDGQGARDRDRPRSTPPSPTARRWSSEAGGRLTLIEDRFSNLDPFVGSRGVAAGVDGVVFDLGVSSMQLDEAARGFSFRLDGPLDMRMGRDGPSAADVVARAGERDLAAIIAMLGEERHARAIARAIVKARAAHPIVTTRALADIVARVVHSEEGVIHPATRTFQALRIFVNDELAELARGLAAAERVLKPAGRLVVVAFHSLEDRIVKTFLAERSRAPASSRHRPQIASAPATFRVLTRRPETPDEAEIAANPRARSAKLRAAERTDAAARSAAIETLLPRLPSLADVMRGRA